MGTIRIAVLLLLGAAAGSLIGLMLWRFLPALVTSAVLAILMQPLQRRALRALRYRDAAAFVSSLGAVVGILAPAVLVSGLVVRQVGAGLELIQGLEGELSPLVAGAAERIGPALAALGIQDPDVLGPVQARIRQLPDVLAGRVFQAFSGVGGLVLQAAIALVALYYLLRDGDAVMQAIRRLIPLDDAKTDFLVLRAEEVIHAAVYGSVLVALIQGALGGLAFWALGIPAPAVWGALMAALSLIPLVGPAFVWLPAGVFFLVTGSVMRGVALLAFGLLVISTVDNVIRAYVVGARAGIHPLVVFLSVLGGIFTFGAVGVLVGPVVFVVGFALMDMARLALGDEPAGTGDRPAGILG